MKYIPNKQFYEKSFKEYGISAKGVHWRSKDSQYKRFEVITDFIKGDIRSSSLIDAGCGFGEYYNFLRVNGLLPDKYQGIDCEDKMINVCKKRFKEVEFYKKNILYDPLEESDYYICSGAMNIMNYDQCSLFIKRCFEVSKKGFVFNFLKSLILNDVKPYEILALCESLTSNIKFEEGYLDNDFTIFMVK